MLKFCVLLHIPLQAKQPQVFIGKNRGKQWKKHEPKQGDNWSSCRWKQRASMLGGSEVSGLVKLFSTLQSTNQSRTRIKPGTGGNKCWKGKSEQESQYWNKGKRQPIHTRGCSQEATSAISNAIPNSSEKGETPSWTMTSPRRNPGRISTNSDPWKSFQLQIPSKLLHKCVLGKGSGERKPNSHRINHQNTPARQKHKPDTNNPPF